MKQKRQIAAVLDLPMGGKFVVFEGIDGSGHSYHLERLAQYWRAAGFDIVTTFEPTLESQAGKQAEELLKSGEPFDPLELQKLFVADRREHVEKIRHWLGEGKLVLCDRYFYSTIAYGAAEGVDREVLIRLNQDCLRPHLTLLFDLPVGVALARLESRDGSKERFEKRQILEKVRRHFLRLAELFNEIRVIDNVPPADEVFQEVLEAVKPLLA